MHQSASRFPVSTLSTPLAARRRYSTSNEPGWFDFVHYEGRHYLLDANKTPGRVPRTGGASIEGLADGFVSLIERL